MTTGSLIPYYMSGNEGPDGPVEPWCFNNINQTGAYESIAQAAASPHLNDPFQMNWDAANPIPDQ
jgi:hypothetical protein